jgi:hypothetical protein
VQGIHFKSRGDGAAVPQRTFQRVQQFDEEPRTVLEAAAITIGAAVEATRPTSRAGRQFRNQKQIEAYPGREVVDG